MKKTILGIVAIIMVAGAAVFANANKTKQTNDCCYPGSPCCQKGSVCCKK